MPLGMKSVMIWLALRATNLKVTWWSTVDTQCMAKDWRLLETISMVECVTRLPFEAEANKFVIERNSTALVCHFK